MISINIRVAISRGPVPREDISNAIEVESFKLESGRYKIFIAESLTGETTAMASLNNSDEVCFHVSLVMMQNNAEVFFRRMYLKLLPI